VGTFFSKTAGKSPTYSFFIYIKNVKVFTNVHGWAASPKKKSRRELETTQSIFMETLRPWHSSMNNEGKLISKYFFPSTKRDCCSIKDDNIAVTLACPASNHNDFSKVF
jgi:hypothetical protein